MVIYCKVCNRAIRSDKPDPQADVLMQMTNHLQSHQEQSIRLKETILTSVQLLSTYLLIRNYVKIPDEEKEFRETFRQNEELIIGIFGLEPATEQAQEN